MTNKTRILKDILWVFILFGAVAGIFRLWLGLGPTTNLNDEFPWGLWKILNMIAGVALSTGGFTLGFLVYVLKLDRFKPLIKPAILIAFLGYGSSCFALLFDIGLPHRFWHPLFMFNPNSFLFEVFWCVMLYFTITAIEAGPTFLERWGFPKLVHALHRIAPAAVIIGISLSSLHHSSLGSLFLITPLKLHPLWYSPLLPIYFILTAMAGGFMIIILARLMLSWLYHLPQSPVDNIPKKNLLAYQLKRIPVSRTPSLSQADRIPITQLSVFAAILMSAVLTVKLAELVINGTVGYLFEGSWESILYITEIVLMGVIPILVIAFPHTRRSDAWLRRAAFLTVAGLVLNRLNVGIFGYYHDARTAYFPSLIEWALSLGVIAGALWTFLFCMEYFEFFKSGDKETSRLSIESASHQRTFADLVFKRNFHRVTLIAVFTLPLAWIWMMPSEPDHMGFGKAMRQPLGADTLRSVLKIDGNRSGIFTNFPHADHEERLGEGESCKKCHHLSLPGDKYSACSHCHKSMAYETNIFNHSAHITSVAVSERLSGRHPGNHSCGECHPGDQPKSAATAKNCHECHKDDMLIHEHPEKEDVFTLASGYQAAMHGQCIECHEEQAEEAENPHLADCSTCHTSIKSREMKTRDKELRDKRLTLRPPDLGKGS